MVKWMMAKTILYEVLQQIIKAENKNLSQLHEHHGKFIKNN